MHSLLTFDLFGGRVVLVRVALEAAAHFTPVDPGTCTQFDVALQQVGLFCSHSSSPHSDAGGPMVSSLPSVGAVAPGTLLRQHWSPPMTKIPCSK